MLCLPDALHGYWVAAPMLYIFLLHWCACILQVRADTCQDGQAQQLVAQKYIETPLLAKGRKFDIRQWVLVTCWEPLTVWFYDACYLRFCAEDYKPSNFDNIFCHLSNNSIAKKSKKFESGAQVTVCVVHNVQHKPHVCTKTLQFHGSIIKVIWSEAAV